MDYLLQASICLITFYLFYFLFLGRDKFLQLQRAYLIGTFALSFIIPIVKFDPPVREELILLNDIEIPAINLSDSTVVQASNAWEMVDYLWLVYGIGAFVMFIRLSKNLWKIFDIIRTSDKEKFENYVLVHTKQKIPFASFYKYIFIQDTHELKQEDLSYLLLHEQKHVQDRHSIDITLIAIAKVFFWFNPVLWLYERDLKSVHEFICDEKVVQQTSKNNYEKLLIKSLFEKVGLPLTSSFNDISIKNRIIMMNKQNSIWIKRLKVLVCLPLIFLLLLACNSEGLPANTPTEVFGIVTDAEGKGLPGVNVVVEGTQTGAITNLKGEYRIGNLGTDQSLTYSFVGFNSVTLPVGSRSVIDVVLEKGEQGSSSEAGPVRTKIDLQYEIDVNDGEKLSGKLTDKDGNPLDGYSVIALGEEGATKKTKTDANGNFEVLTTKITERFVVFDGKNAQVVRIEKD